MICVVVVRPGAVWVVDGPTVAPASVCPCLSSVCRLGPVDEVCGGKGCCGAVRVASLGCVMAALRARTVRVVAVPPDVSVRATHD